MSKLSVIESEAMYIDILSARKHQDFKTDDFSADLSFSKFYRHPAREARPSLRHSIVDYYHGSSSVAISNSAARRGSNVGVPAANSESIAIATANKSPLVSFGIELQHNPLSKSMHTIEEDRPAGSAASSEPPPSRRTEVGEMNMALPWIPTMEQLLKVWVGILIATALISFLSPYKTQSAVVAFQLSASVVAFILCSTYRMTLVGSFHWTVQAVLQNAVLFVLMMIPLVLFSSSQWVSDGNGGLQQFMASSEQFADFGAGNYLAFLLNPAIVSLAFATVDPLIAYYHLLPFLVPVIFLSCTLILFQGAVLAFILRSPPVIAYPLITKCITTPIALSIASITGANTGVVAASSVLTGLLSLRIGATYLGHFKVTNPVSRGLVSAVSGSFLGVVGLDERGETEASGVGMASFAIATVSFAILMGAIAPLRVLLENIS